MKKYNLSNIMKRAWELVKKVGFGISEALKKAWSEAKEGASKMTGTEKQIKWAEDIIREARNTIERNITLIKGLQKKHGFKVRQNELEAYVKCGETLEKVIESKENAADIIAIRHNISSRAINAMVNRYAYKNN